MDRSTGPTISERTSAFAPSLVFDGLFFDFVELVEADQGFDVVPSGDAGVLAEAGEFARLLQLHQRMLGVVETDQQVQDGPEQRAGLTLPGSRHSVKAKPNERLVSEFRH